MRPVRTSRATSNPTPASMGREKVYQDRDEGNTEEADPSINPLFLVSISLSDETGLATVVTERETMLFPIDSFPSLLHNAISTYVECPDDGEWHDLPDQEAPQVDA